MDLVFSNQKAAVEKIAAAPKEQEIKDDDYDTIFIEGDFGQSTSWNARINCWVFPRCEGFQTEISDYEETMLYRYSCKDMGLNCGFVLKGETLEEVTKKALEHVKEAHINDFNSIQSQAQHDEMQKALARSIRVVAG